ncbi:MAG: IS66 family transposase [Acidimicrobiales bacterium]
MSEPTRDQLATENAALRAQNASQAAEIERLIRKVAELEQLVNQSSKNSSMPPSSDSPKERAEATKTRADRRAAAKAARQDEVARRRGKQPGAAGKNLAVRADPDEIVDHTPACCGSCGADLADAAVEGVERRQVNDTPRPVLICTEHRAITKRCRCGAVTKGVFPREAIAPASYGPNVRASALYLLFGQHLSVERTAEAMSAMLGADVSTGFVAQLGVEAAGGLTGFITEIRRRLLRTGVICVDETSDQVRTKKWWFHTVTSERYTYLFASPTRGKAAPDEAGVLGQFGGVMMHDRLAMYFNYEKADHAICGAHVLRELAAIAVRFDQGWASDMAELLTEMNDAAHAARAAGRTRLSARKLGGFLARYDAIVECGLDANPAPLGRERDYLERRSFNLVSALAKLKTEATRFAADLSVPMTNNAAERSLRMAKLHHKISNCFQSDDGARAFATVRSYLATARQHGVGGLDVLARLFGGQAWIPPRTT